MKPDNVPPLRDVGPTETAVKARTDDAEALHEALSGIWDTPTGWGRFSAVNHNVIGRRFILTSLVFFAIGGLLAMLIRVQLASQGSVFMDPGTYAQVFTMHGTIMMFLFAIPFFEGIAIWFLPKLLGTRDMAFPRMGAYGYWCYLFGGSILIVALVMGVAPDRGWFMYTPLSSSTYSPGINADIWLLGITFVEISALSAAIEIVVSILKIRAPGMSLDRMPIFAWYMLVVGGMMLVGFPPLILGSLLLEAERAFGLPFFDPTRGGDPLLWQHLFWLFGHPEVYIIFLPAAGAISTMLPVFARTRLAGYRIIVAAVVSMGFLSFGLWVHHMFTTGLPHLSLAFFSAASALVAIPTAVQIFAWLATLAHGRPRPALPMLWIFGFFFVFVIGGLTGVMLAMVPFDWQAHDTHFVVAHLHYVLVGGFLFPMIAALYYWLPQFGGRSSEGGLGKPAFWLFFVGFNATFFQMHLTGLLGMTRRTDRYFDPAWEALNFASSVGSFVMTMGVALIAVDLVMKLRFAKKAEPNPWGAGTLEWAVGRMPPPAYNFASLPQIATRADALDPVTLGKELASGVGHLGHTRNGWQEVLGVDMTTGRPEQIVILPAPTFLPLWTAMATGAVVLTLLFKVYWLTALPVIAVVVLFLMWTPGTSCRRDYGLLTTGHVDLPVHTETPRPPSWYAMAFALVADATAFTSLLFGTLFLWLSGPEAGVPPVGLMWSGIAAVGLLLAAAGGRTARPERHGGLVMAMLGHLTALVGFAMLAAEVVAPTGQALAATTLALLLWMVAHCAMGVVIAGFGQYRTTAGYVSVRRSADLRTGRLWHDYVALTGFVALAFLQGVAA